MNFTFLKIQSACFFEKEFLRKLTLNGRQVHCLQRFLLWTADMVVLVFQSGLFV